MKMFKIIILILLYQSSAAQETIIKSNYSIRDFFKKDNEITYIEKRMVFTKTVNSFRDYFIGGYGLEIYDNSEKDEIISVSNELLRPVCSVRFYNKPTDSVQEVYYYIKARALDAFLAKEAESMILSLENKKILVVDYSKKPEFIVTHNIQLNAMSRRVFLNQNVLYFCTDLGDVFSYNLTSKEQKKIVSVKKIITDLVKFDESIVFTTIDGEIIKFNLKDKTTKKIKLSNNFALNSILYQQNKLIFGTFKGSIIVVNTDNMTIDKELKYHRRSVLKILNFKDNEFYSSSIDHTLKKWQLN